MKAKISLLYSFFFLSFYLSGYLSANAQSGWVRQYPATPNPNESTLTSVSFIDANTGYASGQNGVFMKTTNGGASWSKTFLTAPGTYAGGVHFFNANTGLLFTNNDIRKTYDGGNTWTVKQIAGSSSEYVRIVFVNALTGWVNSSINGSYYMGKTTDAGETWTSLPFQSFAHDIVFLNELTGYASNSDLYKTTDGGSSWQWVSNLTKDWAHAEISFLNPNTGWATLHHESFVKKTTDGGNTWANLSRIDMVEQIKFFNENTGWICTHMGEILKTTNGGYNWQQQHSQSGFLFKMQFLDMNTGWTVGISGTILKTITSGSTSVQSASSLTPDNFSLSQNYPNPFNPSTTINFQIPKNNFVSLKVFDINGKEVSELVNENLTAGEYKINFDGSTLPSGVYYYKLTSENFSETKKMMLVK